MLENGKTVLDFRKRKFFRMTREVVFNEDVPLKPVDIAVYSVLCMYADNDDASSYPSVETIANKSRCSIRTAQRSIRTLEDVGYIGIKNRFDRRGFKTTNHYIIHGLPDKYINLKICEGEPSKWAKSEKVGGL